MPTKSEHPRRPVRVSGKFPALVLAIAVHVAFIAVLVFSVRWQNKTPEPIVAELYSPPVKSQKTEAPTPPPVPPNPAALPEPKPNPAPLPEPKPEPAPPVEPQPAAVAKPAPPIEKPDSHEADIALKAMQDDERRKREQADRDKKEADKREAELKRQEDQKRAAEARLRQTREAEALRAQAEREAQSRSQQQAQREAQIRAQQQAEREAQIRAQQQAERDERIRSEQQQSAHARASAEYIERIKGKVRGNVIEPGEIVGNPQAEFDVIQLPTGEIIDVRLTKSSGLRAYDDAIERAIHKSSPLPRPAQPEDWRRELKLQFRPRE